MLVHVVMALAGGGLVGIVVFLVCSRKLAVARAEIRSKDDSLAQLRSDATEGLRRQAEQYQRQIDVLNGIMTGLQGQLDEARGALSALNAEKVGKEAELAAEREKIQALHRQYEETLKRAEDRFKALAQSILEERSEKLKAEGEKGMQRIAEGLRECIRDFRARVEKINSETAERNVKLDARIAGLVDQTNAVSEQANNLAGAIRGEAQVTGEWGEMQLKRVLELGGLQETVDYTYQETFASPGADHRNLRTDVLIKMSDGRWMVIDAKTTMAAYADFAQAKTADERQNACRRVIDSVHRHVEEMKTAAYHRNLEQVTGRKILNTMLMYIPFEDVYLLAMKAEVRVGGEKKLLRDYARDNDIVFINATGLLTVVRMLADFWAAAKADKKAMKIKEAAEAMAEKFRVFLEAEDGFMKMGSQLAAVVKSYNESVKRLAVGPGNIMKKVSDLKDMGVNAPVLPPVEEVEAKTIEQAF